MQKDKERAYLRLRLLTSCISRSTRTCLTKQRSLEGRRRIKIIEERKQSKKTDQREKEVEENETKPKGIVVGGRIVKTGQSLRIGLCPPIFGETWT